MNPERITELCSRLMLWKFFALGGSETHAALVLEIGQLCSDEEQVRWLIGRMLELFDDWPGPRAMRGVFCQRHRPRSGADLRSYNCKEYPNGFPSEKDLASPAPLRKIGFNPASNLPALPPGHKVSVDPSLEVMVSLAVGLFSMPAASGLSPRAERFAKELEKNITAPQDRPLPPAPTNPNFQPISESDVERILAEERVKKQNATESQAG